MEHHHPRITALDRRNVAILGAAALLGVCGDLLLRAWPLGINVAIWVATLLLAVALLSQLRPQATAARGWWLFPVGLLLAFSLAWRASPVLQALNVGALFVALTLSAFRLREGRLRIGGVTEFVFAGVVSVASCILGPVLLAISVRWRSLPPRASSPVATAIGRGLLLGIPLLAIFGGLFIAADAVFSNLVTGL